jgi:acetate kinase
MTGGTGGVISPPGATPRAVVVATREEWMIACDTARLARQGADIPADTLVEAG